MYSIIYTEIQEHITIAVVCILLYFASACVCGKIADVLGYNRGFTRSQFWWGFFLGVLGICMVALMPTYRIYDEEEKDTFNNKKARELAHYAPALKPHNNDNTSFEEKNKTIEYREKPNAEKINEKQYWGNDIDSIIEPKKNSK